MGSARTLSIGGVTENVDKVCIDVDIFSQLSRQTFASRYPGGDGIA
jgi:hypothetical protein